MAPKRSAQPPPPPPPPPAASSEETVGSEESEEEEEIAHSPPPAAPKMTAPLLLKGQESEGSEEEEDDEEEEDEEEEEEKVNHVAPPPATKNPSPPPPKREDSETSGSGDDEEEEETDDEASQPKPAPIQVAEEKGAKPSSGEDKKAGAPFERTWSTDDEVRILEAMAAHRREHGTLPQTDALAAALAGRLDHSSCSLDMLKGKIRNLKRRYSLASNKGELPSKDHDRRLYDLSKSVWGSVAAVANGGAPRTLREFGEMCELYPYLAEEVKALQREHQGLFKREFMMMDDEKARSLDTKIKRQRMHQLRTHNRRHDLTKEVTKTLIELVD